MLPEPSPIPEPDYGGKGVPSLQNPNVRGDHYVTLVVETPKKLNKKQKEALKAYAEACGEKVD